MSSPIITTKEKTERAFNENVVISKVRESIPTSLTATESNIYAVKGGSLVVAPTTSSSTLTFSKAETFYSDFTAWKQARGEDEQKKKKLSLEEELLAERFRASTDVDIAGVSAIGVRRVVAATDGQAAMANKDWWLMVKRPGQTLLWKESSSSSSNPTTTTTTTGIFDLYGQVLKSEMERLKITAPMDLQIVYNFSNGGDQDNNTTKTTTWKFSFVAGGNVYVASFDTSAASFSNAVITPITTSGVSGKLEFGTPDFIMQEEFSRYSGVFWSPNRKMVAFSGCDIAHTPQAQLLRPDGSVEEMPFPRVGQDNATCTLFVRFFSRQHTTTTVSTSGKNSPDAQQQEEPPLEQCEQKSIPFAAVLAAYPWAEYIVRVYWLSNKELAIGILSRDQERYAIVRVPTSALVSCCSSGTLEQPNMSLTPKPALLKEHYNEKETETTSKNSSDSRWFSQPDAKSRLSALLKEMSCSTTDEGNLLSLIDSFAILRETHTPSAWVDINDEFHLLTTTASSHHHHKRIACVAQEINEKDPKGFFQVYCLSAVTASIDGREDHLATAIEWKRMTNNHKQLPRGILGASTKVIQDAKKRNWLIASAFLHTAYMQTIVAIPLFDTESVQIVPLTQPDEDASSYSIVQFMTNSNDNNNNLRESKTLIYNATPREMTERKILTKSIHNLDEFLASSLSSSSSVGTLPDATLVNFSDSATTNTPTPLPPRPKLDFFEVPIPGHNNKNDEAEEDDEKLQAVLMLPDDVNRQGNSNDNNSSSIPLFVYTYGGPHVSFVTLTRIVSYPLFEMMRRLGFAVLAVDSRMATRHSLKTNSDGKLKMGSFEIRDVLAAVDHVLKTHSFIDRNRVGLHGFSYGGYVSLLALGQAPDRFKVTVAGAPVTDWRLYDSGYTERYMGLLPRDKKAYEESTVWQYAQNFPDEWNRCFILHGFLDENVHITHTQKLLSEFVKYSKPYNLLAYPGERHGIRKTKESYKHHTLMTLRAFVEFL